MATTSKKSAGKKAQTAKKTTKSAATKKSTRSTSAKVTSSQKASVKKDVKESKLATLSMAENSAKETVKGSGGDTEKSIISATKVVAGSIKAKLDTLRRWNMIMALLHAAQAIAVLTLARPGSGIQGITTSYLTTDSLAGTAERPVLVAATRHLFDVRLSWLVAAFFAMSAIAHFSIATWYRRRYESNLQDGINRARWIEYGLSASTMMVAIGVLSGISDISTLLAIFALDLVMNLTGLAMEIHNRGAKKENVNWLTYKIGCIAGIVPWIIFAIYVFGAHQYGTTGVPGFVYWIYLSIFLFFNSFAYNMYRQYKQKGRWTDYLFGEKVYMILSLVAKAALAWQVFAGSLRP